MCNHYLRVCISEKVVISTNAHIHIQLHLHRSLKLGQIPQNKDKNKKTKKTCHVPLGTVACQVIWDECSVAATKHCPCPFPVRLGKSNSKSMDYLCVIDQWQSCCH